MPESPNSDVQLQGPLPRNQVRDWIMYSRRNNFRKGKVTSDEGNDSLRRSDYVMALEEGVENSGQDVQALDKAPLCDDGHDHNFDRGSPWVMDHIIPACKRVDRAVAGRNGVACFSSIFGSQED